MDKNPGSRKSDGVRRRWRGWPAWLSMRDSPGKTLKTASGDSLAHGLTHVAAIIGMIAAVVGAGHLAGWFGGYLTQRGLSTITMKTNAALCLTLVGVALMLLVPAKARRVRRWAARVCAALALVVGLLTLVENLSGWDFGIDQLLAAETPGAIAVTNPNRMGMPASLSLTLIGLALLILSRRDRRGVRVAQALALAVCLIALLPAIGFLYGAQDFYGIARYTGIAWPTALALLLLGLGLLCARPAEGLMAQVTADDPGGISLRRLLPAFVLLPLLLGWLRLAGERAGVFDAATGTGIMMLVFIITFAALAYHAGRRASRSASALRESETHLARAQQMAHLGSWYWDIAEDRLYWSDEIYRLFGLQPGEFVPRHKDFLGFIHPQDRQRVEQAVQDALMHEPYNLDFCIVQKGGKERYVHSEGETTFDKDDNPVKMEGTVQDITDRRKAEEELRFTEARFRALFEQTPLSIQILSPEGRTVEINRAWGQLWAVTGLSYDLKDWNILHDRQIEAMGVLPYIQRGFAGEATETPVVLYDPAKAGYPGRPRWLKAYIYPIKDETGRILQVVVTHVDVTELVEAEKALARSVKDLEFLSVSAVHYLEAMPSDELLRYTAQQLQAIAGHAIIAVSEYDSGTNQTTVRGVTGPEDKLRKLPRLLGRDPVGMVFTVAEGTLERAMPGRLDFVKGGLYDLTFHQMPLPLATSIEQQLNVGEIYAMPFALGEDFMGTVAVATDRAEGLQNRELIEAIVNHAALALKRTRTEEALRERERALRDLTATLEAQVAQRTAELGHRARQLQKLALELSQAEERERRRIALTLHEDLQQQIAGARFHLNLLRGRARDDRQRADVDRVDEMLKEVIEKSRGLSYDLSPAVLHMNDLAEVLQWLVNRVRAQHGLIAHVDVLGEMMLQSEALTMFLFRAAQEMLFNVVKHARVNEVAIRVRRLGRYVCLSVSDQGRGFDPQELKETSGFGLLSLRERTELLGGRMKIESATGQGSRFRIVVPDGPKVKSREKTAEDLVYVPAAVSPPFSSGALRVLLVDDHEIVRQGLAALLQELPEVVVVGEAANGRDAINMTNELRPDVVIMDVAMPLMSGDQATRQIKTYLPQTRVIALSMYDEADKQERMYQAGAEGYVLKTASSEELLAAIRGKAPDS